MRRKITQLGISILVVLIASLPVFAQSDASTATIKGSVTDPNNAVVAGATVTATSLERGNKRSVRTESDGGYAIQTLQPGLYEIRIEAAGFETTVLSKVELTVGQTGVYDVQLRTGGVSAEVVVTADVPLIEVERTQQANTIDKRQVENLPNVGRTFQNYVYTLPGVSNSNAPRAQLAPPLYFGPIIDRIWIP